MLTNDENPVRYRSLRRGDPMMDDAPDGLDPNWYWAVPAVFAALTGDTATVPVPSLPQRDDPHSQSLGYWGALHYLLLYRLGWSNPGQGLRNWIDSGASTDDPGLRLIQAVWGADGGLDNYIAWTIMTPMRFLEGGAPTPHQWGKPTAAPTEPRWLALKESVTRRASPGGQFGLAGGSDPLHLSMHAGEGAKRDPNAKFEVIDHPAAPRARFVSGAAGAWYHDLMQRAAVLPRRAHDWRIEVYVRPLGFMGVYRRSSVTGLMFSGRHRVHQLGN